MIIEKLTSSDQPEENSAGCSHITDIKQAIKNPNRVNIFIDNKYAFSLDISQLTEAKLKTGQQLTEHELENLHHLSDFGKLYTRALEYTLSRPHSEKEIHDYLSKKTIPQNIRVKNPKTNEWQTKPKKTYSPTHIPPILERLKQKGYINDANFAAYLTENYHTKKGASRRRLELELRKKGINQSIINEALKTVPRSDRQEIQKILAKKTQKNAADPQKLKQYLLRQGFTYEDIESALSESPQFL